MLRLGIPVRTTPSGPSRRRGLVVPLLAALMAVTLAAPANAAAPDTVAPTVPGAVEVSELTTTSLTLRWEASVDDVGVVGYRVYEGFEDTLRTRVTTTNSITITGLTRARTYGYTVSAYDAAGNLSPMSSRLQVTTEPGDHAPPAAPGTPVASSITSSSVMLRWVPSTDDAYVASHQVYMLVAGELVRVYTTPPYLPGRHNQATIMFLRSETTYTFVVRATDEVGNVSPLSPPVTVTTAALPRPPCKVDYRITSQWPGGFQAAVKIMNTSAQPLSTWRVGWAYRNGETVRHLWNGVLVGQQAGSVTIGNAAWNATVAPGGSVEFGFLGTWSSANHVPPVFTVNGTQCGDPPVPPPS